MTTLIIDTETTGTDPGEVIELAWHQVDSDSDTDYCERFKPVLTTTFGALAVHHILPEELAECRPTAEAKLPADCTHIIGHNVDFDWGVLGKPEVKRICTLAMARKLYPELDSHKLGSMLYALHGVNDITRQWLRDAHSAAADVDFCGYILRKMLVERAPTQSLADPEALWKFSEMCRIPDKMTFGKHKGLAIRDLPRSYATWMLKQEDMDEYVIKAVQQVYGRLK